MHRVNRISGEFLLVSVLALSLVLSAFAHRAAPASNELAGANALVAGIDLEAFRLPDGSLPSFCLNTGGENETPGGNKTSCDFCTLAHGFGIPIGVVIPLPTPQEDCPVLPVRASVAAYGGFDPATPITGPPVIS